MILPIAFGASWLSRVIIGRHTVVFLAGGALMLVLGGAMITGWKLPLPMPGMQARRGRGPGTVFALGAFSGTASACCAPVLAGVVALSGAAGSFSVALAVGVAYVFGMVIPLLGIALLWDRYDWGSSRLLRGRTITLRAFGRVRLVHSTSLVSGLVLIAMGILVVALAFTGTAMPRGGWQAELTARLQHYAKVVLSWVDAVPGWATTAAVFSALGLLIWKAMGQATADAVEDEESEHAGIEEEDALEGPTGPTADAVVVGTGRTETTTLEGEGRP